MPKKKTTVFIVLPVLMCLLALLFTYLALLGENNRIGTVIEDFFTGIQENNYPQTLEYLSYDLKDQIGDDVERFYETCFLLELALLKEYKLLNEEDFIVKTRKARLWVPLVHNTTIPVSVSVQKKEPKKLAEYLGASAKTAYIDNLFTVVREDGSWKISSINHADSTIGETFVKLQREVKLDQYLQEAPSGFRVSSFTVKTEGMTPIEHRRLSFIIHKVLRYLGEDTMSNADDDGLPLY